MTMRPARKAPASVLAGNVVNAAGKHMKLLGKTLVAAGVGGGWLVASTYGAGIIATSVAAAGLATVHSAHLADLELEKIDGQIHSALEDLQRRWMSL